MSQDEDKKMTPQEFREQGYLQEVNRRFLHPLGLSLQVIKDEDGTERFGALGDRRNSPEGLLFAEGMINPEWAERIHREGEKKYDMRYKKYGWYTQPYK
jgi:hypothetical protein